jgi:hypothetical protein
MGVLTFNIVLLIKKIRLLIWKKEIGLKKKKQKMSENIIIHTQTKKFLSFDIGIRCLAISVIEYMYDLNSVIQPWSRLNILHLELVDLIEESKKYIHGVGITTNARTINIHDLCTIITHLLFDKRHLLQGVTDICVEQQPIHGHHNAHFGSSRMKIIQHCILTFFETFYMVSALSTTLTRPQIYVSSSSNKLKLTLCPDNLAVQPLKKTTPGLTYKQRKEHTVNQFNMIMNWCNFSTSQLRDMYSELTKQNDISDCVLQAIYELQKFGWQLSKKMNKKKKKVSQVSTL